MAIWCAFDERLKHCMPPSTWNLKPIFVVLHVVDCCGCLQRPSVVDYNYNRSLLFLMGSAGDIRDSVLSHFGELCLFSPDVFC